MLMTEHNLWFYQRLMQAMRHAIAQTRLRQFADEFFARYRKPSLRGAEGDAAIQSP
jgi:queuine tRNA-ribosyltransferase